MSDATVSVSSRMAAIVFDIESAASAVSSTAAVIAVTVWACASIAKRMRLADSCTSNTVDLIDALQEDFGEVDDRLTKLRHAAETYAVAVGG